MKIISVTLLCFYSVTALSSDSFYDSCKWVEEKSNNEEENKRKAQLKTLTHSVISGMEDFLNEDEHISNLNQCYDGAQKKTHPPFFAEPSHIASELTPIPPVCFLASMIYGSESFKNHRKYICEKKEQVNANKTKYQSVDDTPCFSKRLVNGVSAVFNKMAHCFDMSFEDQQILFTKIVQESGFLVNARSVSGPRCPGQLSRDTVLDMNTNIVVKERVTKDVYEQALSRCPSLSKRTIPPQLTNEIPSFYINKKGKRKAISRKNVAKDVKSHSVTCPLVMDPSVCFFYTFLFHSYLGELFEDKISRYIPQVGQIAQGQESSVSEEFTDKFGTGLTVTDLAVVKGRFLGKTGEAEKEQTFIFNHVGDIQRALELQGKRQKEIEPSAKNRFLSDETRVQKISLIDEEDKDKFRVLTTRLSYNAGTAVTRLEIKNFFTYLKEQIAGAVNKRCAEDSQNRFCAYRKRILNGQALRFSDIQKEFIRHLDEGLRTFVHRSGDKKGQRHQYSDETLQYADKIDRQSDYFQSQQKNQLPRRLLQQYFEKHNQDIKPEVLKDFENQTVRLCQFPKIKDL